MEENVPQDPEIVCNPCPKCGQECEIGFGLAGGGYGTYLYCPICEEIVDKWQERDEDETSS